MGDNVGLVLSIERCSFHDGPGIRTTVFLKGCPLHCLWCHNPESIDPRPELYYLKERCAMCRACAAACPQGCHSLADGTHTIDRSECTACGACVTACPAGALEIKGCPMSVDKVMAEILKDRAYYDESGGGLTISGGEPMAQFGFTRALLAAARAAGIHTCIETSGIASTDRYLEVAALVSLFLIDWKETDPTKHRQWTGVDNVHVREVISSLDRAGAQMVLRCPIVPSCNARPDHFAGIAALADSLTHVRGVEVMPYHPMGSSKSARIGKAYALTDACFTDDDVAESWRAAIRAGTKVAVG